LTLKYFWILQLSDFIPDIPRVCSAWISEVPNRDLGRDHFPSRSAQTSLFGKISVVLYGDKAANRGFYERTRERWCGRQTSVGYSWTGKPKKIRCSGHESGKSCNSVSRRVTESLAGCRPAKTASVISGAR